MLLRKVDFQKRVYTVDCGKTSVMPRFRFFAASDQGPRIFNANIENGDIEEGPYRVVKPFRIVEVSLANEVNDSDNDLVRKRLKAIRLLRA